MIVHKVYGPKANRHSTFVAVLEFNCSTGWLWCWNAFSSRYPPQNCGFAKAVELAIAEQAAETKRLTQLREQLWQQLQRLQYSPNLLIHPTTLGNLQYQCRGCDGAAPAARIKAHPWWRYPLVLLLLSTTTALPTFPDLPDTLTASFTPLIWFWDWAALTQQLKWYCTTGDRYHLQPAGKIYFPERQQEAKG